MTLVSALILLLLGSLASYSLLSFLLGQNSRILVPDRPNSRSLHSQVVPKGGGLVIIVSTASLIGIYAAMYQSIAVMPVLIASLVGGIAVLGWFDDRHSLRIRTRIIVQIAIACAMVYLLAPSQGINIAGYRFDQPDWLLFVGLVVWIVWMTNLFNFMDGIDGLVATQSTIAAIVLAFWFHQVGAPELVSLNLALVGALAGFSILNWRPARVFLGDIGSLTLGIYFAVMGIIGWTVYHLPVEAFVLLYGVMLCDTSVTLAVRIFKGERWWEAHSSHFYQRLVGLGYNHAQVTSVTLVITLCLSIFGSFVIQNVGPGWLWMTLGLVILAIYALAVLEKERAYLNKNEER
jgi:Fuc2NAc and GlcNAc transferase